MILWLLIWAAFLFNPASVATGENLDIDAAVQSCGRHFAGVADCSQLGAPFRQAVAQGQEICRERYGTELGDLGLAAGSCSPKTDVETSPCSAKTSNVEEVSALGFELALISQAPILSKIVQTRKTYLLLFSQAQPGSACRQELKALDSELQAAATIPSCLPEIEHAPSEIRSAARESPVTPALSPVPAPKMVLNLTLDGPPVSASSAGPAPTNPEARPLAQAPPLVAVNLNSAPAFTVEKPPDPPSADSSIFPSYSQWPPKCALSAMVQDIQKQKAEDAEKGGVSRFFSHLFGGGPPSNADEVISQPAESFEKLAAADQAKYLQTCMPADMMKQLQEKLAPSSRPPQCAVDAMVEDAKRQKADDDRKSWFSRTFSNFFGSVPSVSPEQIIANPEMGFFEIDPEARQKYLASCPDDELAGTIAASAAPPLRPPQCAVDAMTNEIKKLKEDDAKQGWVSRSVSHLFGGQAPPENADDTLAHPEEAFATLPDQDRMRFLLACSSDEIAQLQIAATRQAAPPVAVPATEAPPSGSSAWPPQCAVDAMVKEIGDIKASYESKSAIGRGLAWLLGNSPPDGADQALAHPKPAFLSLDRAKQEKYIAKCQPAELNRELGTSTDPLAADTQLAGGAPPQCALDAFKNDTLKLQQKDQARGWLSRTFSHLFGGGPPSNADQIVADPASEFSRLSIGEKSRYEFECSPMWVQCTAGDEPSFLERLRDKIYDMGPLGKFLLVLGSGVLGAAFWRIRGGFLRTGSTTMARIIGTLPMALLGMVMLGPWGFVAGASMFATVALIGWGKWMGMTNVAVDLPAMTARGVWQTLIPGLFGLLGGLSPWFTVAGFVMGPIYYIMNRYGPNIFPYAGSGSQVTARGFASPGTQSAEVFTGFALYSLFALAALTGNHHAAAPLAMVCPKG